MAIDHLRWVRQEVEIIVDTLHIRRVIVPSRPVTVDEEPTSIDVHRIPAVIGWLTRDIVSGSIACSLRPTGNRHTVKSCVSKQHTLDAQQDKTKKLNK